jgi:hypothetical protein
MPWLTNVTQYPGGSFRSLQGYAAEQAFLARALKAGFNIFYKVWRDLEYDAVLDADSTLYRIEVKGASTGHFDLTRGGRSGIQIDRGVNKTRPINRDDCDFVVCVDTNDFTCYIVPIEVHVLLGRSSYSATYLELFKEKWSIFLGGRIGLDKRLVKDGLSSLPDAEIDAIIAGLNINPDELTVPYKIAHTHTSVTDIRTLKIIRIWEHLGD